VYDLHTTSQHEKRKDVRRKVNKKSYEAARAVHPWRPRYSTAQEYGLGTQEKESRATQQSNI
jgi:hypothetical protein